MLDVLFFYDRPYVKSVAGSFCKTRGSDFIRVVEVMSVSMGDVINTLGVGSEVNVVFEWA